MYTDAFHRHIREHGVRLIKFDNLAADCVNPRHEHLPGIYSTEPRPFTLTVTPPADGGATLAVQAHFAPR